jgi:HEPN domain-containing protein
MAEHLSDVRGWLTKADHHRRVVRLLADYSPDMTDMVCAHAQQWAEAALKAVLVHHQIYFPRTHSVAALVSLCQAFLRELEVTPADAALLDQFGEQALEPADRHELTLAQAGASVAAAERVWHVAMGQVPPATHP